MEVGQAALVMGSDEVGWGAVAGPLYVVAVAMPIGWGIKGLRDSKKLTRQAREALFEPLVDQVRGFWELSVFTPEQIDQLGAMPCLVQAHTAALQRLLKRVPAVSKIIVDGNLRLPDVPSAVSLPKADDNFQVVAAASVLAKVLRDDAMTALALKYPQYGFESNVGYGKPAIAAAKRYGACPAHRRSYLKKHLS